MHIGVVIAITVVVCWNAYIGVALFLIFRQTMKAEQQVKAIAKQGYDAYARAYAHLKGEA